MRDDILWGYTPGDCKPYLKFREREILFRELVIGFFGGDGKSKPVETTEQKYCRACKAKHKAKKTAPDCTTCNFTLDTEP